jgi:DNA-binding Lrp family transcriptional regulator
MTIHSTHNMREASLNGYIDSIPKTKTQYEAILKVMQSEKVYTRREIAFLTGIETSTVSARINKLLKRGDIKEVGVKVDPYTGVHVNALMKVTGEQLGVDFATI